MKKLIASVFLLVGIAANAQNVFGDSEIYSDKKANTTSDQAVKSDSEVQKAGNPGNPVPINDYAYILLAAGVSIAAWAGIKKNKNALA